MRWPFKWFISLKKITSIKDNFLPSHNQIFQKKQQLKASMLAIPMNFTRTSFKTTSLIWPSTAMRHLSPKIATRIRSLLWPPNWECFRNKVLLIRKLIIIYLKQIQSWTTCIRTINNMPRLRRITCRTWALNSSFTSRLLKKSSRKAFSLIPTSFWIHLTPKTFTTSKWRTRIFKIKGRNPINSLNFNSSRNNPLNPLKKAKVRASTKTLT